MRGIEGLGAAVVLPAALSIVMNMFSEGAERNKALASGAASAPRVPPSACSPAAAHPVCGLAVHLLPQRPHRRGRPAAGPAGGARKQAARARRRYDPLGAITVTGALVVLVYAISQAPAVGWTAVRTLALLAASAALLTAFLVIETRAEAPVLPLRLFRMRTLAGSNAVGFLLGASFFAFIFIGTLYMQQVLGYSALKTGLAWLAASVTAVVLAGLSQMLVTRASAKLVMAAGMVLIGSGILWATQFPAHGHFWADLAGPLFLRRRRTFAFIPVSIGALAGVTERDAGAASGLLNTSQQLGGAIGVAVASTVAATHSRDLLVQGHTAAAALTGGFQWALWVCGLTGWPPYPSPSAHPPQRTGPGRGRLHANRAPRDRNRRT